jgi:hypothetical protein
VSEWSAAPRNAGARERGSGIAELEPASPATSRRCSSQLDRTPGRRVSQCRRRRPAQPREVPPAPSATRRTWLDVACVDLHEHG